VLAFLASLTGSIAVPDYFTELFDTTQNDTDFQSWLFTPDGSESFYRVLRTENVTAFPTDPTGGTAVTLSDDEAIQATLSGGQQVSLYGVSYSSLFIGSNGYVTFGAGDSRYNEAIADHFSQPRVAALFDDLFPPTGGTISWRQLADRVAVTWDGIFEISTTNVNSLQIELFFDGRIRITCLGVGVTDGLIGLSRGADVPADFVETDFSALPALALTVNVPDAATEGSAPVTGAVTASPAPSADLVVTLNSDDTTEATVPASVTILAGQTSATFPVTVVDDSGRDGTREVTISATAAGYGIKPDTILIHDNEPVTLTLTVPATVREGDGSFTATVSMDGPAFGSVEVVITSSSPTELAIPPSAIIPNGATSASFEVGVIDDDIINGTRTVTLGAEMTNWTPAIRPVSMQDNESSTLSVALPASLYEGASATGTVSAAGIVSAPLTVTLAASHPSRLTVDASATILAGQSSATFSLAAIDNSLTDGTQAVTVTASAAGFTTGQRPMNVRDNDVSHFTFAAIASPQVRGAPFPVAITARDIGGLVIAPYSGAPALTASGGLPITPTSASGFVNGVWTGSVTVNGFSSSVTLTVNAGGGHTGTSPAFAVGFGALQRFVWSPIAGPRSVGAAIPASLLAQDSAGNTVTSFTGTVALSGVTGAANASTIVVTEVNPNSPDEIEFMNVSASAVNVSGWSVHLYDADTWPAPRAAFTLPVGSTCAAGQIFRLQEFGTAPGTFPQFFFGGDLAWTPDATTPVAVLLRDSAGNIVDFFCGGTATPASIAMPAAQWAGAPVAAPVVDTLSYARIGSSEGNTAADWVLAAPTLGATNAGLTTPFPPGSSPVAVTPTATGAFVNGAWSGSVAVLQEVAQMRLRASDGAGHDGESASFDVLGAALLAVNGPAGYIASAVFGGSATPASVAFTLTNNGTVPLDWTASKTAQWLTLTPASGTLAVGANTVVTAALPASRLEPGLYTNVITFTNATNGAGNTGRFVSLTVALGAPTLAAEPPATGGLSNSLSWNSIAGAMRYEIERATAADFSGAVSSGPLTTTSHTFSPLLDGTLYFYRVRALRALAGTPQMWTQTSAAEFGAGTASNVTTTPTGEVRLASTGVPIPGRVSNPSFETGTLADWTVQANSAGMAAQASTGAGFSPMPTQGSYYAGLRSAHNTARTAGEYVRLTRLVDLTGATALAFDALLASPGTWSGSLRAEVRIDGATLWSSSTAGPLLDHTVPLAGYTGTHTVEFRAEVIVTGTFNAQWFFFDHVRVVAPGFASSGSLVSPLVAPPGLLHWETLTFTRDLATAGTALAVDVLAADGTPLASGLANGTDLRTLPNVAIQPALRLRANLSTTDSAATPELYDWSVSYRLASATDTASAWSTAVTSLQDATGPTVTLAVASIDPNVVTGTASDPAGIASLTVNGVAATSSNGFATWSANVPLGPGFTTVSLVATDSAVPPNTSTGSGSVFLATSAADQDGDGLDDAWETTHGLDLFDATGPHGALGDFDGDGLANLLERAFGLDPAHSQPAGLPVLTREIHPSDLQPYLVLRYRRLLAPGSLAYTVQLSPDLQSWSPATAAQAEFLGATPNGDGLTETVALRLRPSLSTPGHTTRHVRVEVRVP
jgi:hypothetical protein